MQKTKNNGEMARQGTGKLADTQMMEQKMEGGSGIRMVNRPPRALAFPM